MRPGALFLTIFALPLLSVACSNGAPTVLPAKVDLVTTAPTLMVFKIKDGEAQVGGALIRRVVFGKTVATISYLNKSRKSLKPNYNFRLVDAYGIEVGSFAAKWSFTSIAIDEASVEEKNIDPIEVDKILQHSSIFLPKDWAVPVYLIVDGDPP